MENPATNNHGMLASVGGSTAPIVASITAAKPAYVVFFASKGSRPVVAADILPKLNQNLGRIPDHEFVITPDEQNLGACVESLFSGVPEALARLGAKAAWPEHIDYTGGTKTMSAAVVWASARRASSFVYVGANSPGARTKDGLGTVVDGGEKIISSQNPWNQVAWFEIDDASAAFNATHYATAAVRMGKVARMVSEKRATRIFSAIQKVFEGYAAWDAFDYPSAHDLLNRHIPELEKMAESPAVRFRFDFPQFTATAIENLEAIRGIKTSGTISWQKIDDILANAARRANIEAKYEDATARCYSAIEKIAKHQLRKNYDINISDCRPEAVPDHLRQDYVRRYTSADPATGKEQIKFGLAAAFQLLAAINPEDPVAKTYLACKDKLENALSRRNESFLAHGTTPCGRDAWENLFSAALALRGISETDLTQFPLLV